MRGLQHQGVVLSRRISPSHDQNFSDAISDTEPSSIISKICELVDAVDTRTLPHDEFVGALGPCEQMDVFMSSLALRVHRDTTLTILRDRTHEDMVSVQKQAILCLYWSTLDG